VKRRVTACSRAALTTAHSAVTWGHAERLVVICLYATLVSTGSKCYTLLSWHCCNVTNACLVQCREMTNKVCRCGKKTKVVQCYKDYQCDTKCANWRDCGKHQCKKKVRTLYCKKIETSLVFHLVTRHYLRLVVCGNCVAVLRW
jgi:hypothetical protein